MTCCDLRFFLPRQELGSFLGVWNANFRLPRLEAASYRGMKGWNQWKVLHCWGLHGGYNQEPFGLFLAKQR